MTNEQNQIRFTEVYNGSEEFYLADPTDLTFKKNGGTRWGTKKEFRIPLAKAIKGHLDGTLKKGLVLPPIRKSDNKCIWAAIDVDGEVYKDDYLKQELIEAISRLELPLISCFSKSKGLHLYIFFKQWTDAKTVRDILHTFLYKLDLPEDTECFPKQVKLGPTDTGNGIMLPFMYGIGNDFIKPYYEKNELIMSTGSFYDFLETIDKKKVYAEDIKIELPEKPKTNGVVKDKDTDDGGLTKLEILKKIKDGTIEQHPTMGGKYHSWVQVVIAKSIIQGYGDNEILKMIKEVHEDNRGIGYTWPESYQKQINYARKDSRLNKPNPGDTKILEGQSFEKAAKYEEVRNTYCYVMANDMHNKLGSIDFYQAAQINNFHAHEVFIQKGSLTQKLLKDPDFARAETFITSAKYPPGLINISKPGIIPLVNKGVVLNIYVPNYLIGKKGNIKFLIDFFIWLLGEKKWKVIEQWIAYNIQYPGEKIKWSVVLVSAVEGVGKGLLGRIISRILGSDNVNENANYKHLTNTHNTLLIGTQVLVLNEVSLGDFKSKQEGTNTLKNFVADDVYSCNFKNKPMVKLPNLTNIVINSNDERVVGAPQGGRRYFFCNISKTEQEIIKKTDEGVFQKAWDFVDSDEGAAALIYYFKNEVKIKDPSIFKKRAPQTEDLKELIEQSKHPLQKKLEWDLVRPDEPRKKIFTADWCGLMSFDELNDKLHTKDMDPIPREKFDWGSFGDDAIYKFLAANSDPWNNGDNTRQISIKGVKHRFYNLDDTRCPVPGKSYKDLTPKQIETIYLNYVAVSKEIREEEKNYNEAKEKEPDLVVELKDKIKRWCDPGKYGEKKFKGRDPEKIFTELMNETLKMENNDDYLINNIIKMRKILARGIRTPEQIVEDNKIKEKRREEELKHIVEPKEELGAGDGLHFGQGDF